MAQRVSEARALRQSGLRLSSLDSSSSIKLLTCQIGIMCIQMEIANGTEHSLNPNGILFSYLLAHWLFQRNTCNFQLSKFVQSCKSSLCRDVTEIKKNQVVCNFCLCFCLQKHFYLSLFFLPAKCITCSVPKNSPCIKFNADKLPRTH